MPRCYCLEFEKDWDEGVHLLIFTAHESVQEALGFSPFELVFWHRVCGWLSYTNDPPISLLEYVSTFRFRLAHGTYLVRPSQKDICLRYTLWFVSIQGNAFRNAEHTGHVSTIN